MNILLFSQNRLLIHTIKASVNSVDAELLVQDNIEDSLRDYLNPNTANKELFFFDEDLILPVDMFVISAIQGVKILLHKKNSSKTEGFDHYIPKPFLPTTILEYIKLYTQAQQKQKDLKEDRKYSTITPSTNLMNSPKIPSLSSTLPLHIPLESLDKRSDEIQPNKHPAKKDIKDASIASIFSKNNLFDDKGIKKPYKETISLDESTYLLEDHESILKDSDLTEVKDILNSLESKKATKTPEGEDSTCSMIQSPKELLELINSHSKEELATILNEAQIYIKLRKK